MNKFFLKYKVELQILSIMLLTIVSFKRWSIFAESKETWPLIAALIWTYILFIGIKKLLDIIKYKEKNELEF